MVVMGAVLVRGRVLGGTRLASGKMTECSQSTVRDCRFPRGPQSCHWTNAHERKCDLR